jgi:hypothetical protein
MTQYTEQVENQKAMFAAEDWAKGVSAIHAHSLDSMAYAEGREDGSVLDTCFNSGLIKREIRSSGEVVWFGKRLKGQDLLDEYRRKA